MSFLKPQITFLSSFLGSNMSGSYSWTHSSGGGGLNFGSGGHCKVTIEGSQQTFHRDDIQEHSRPGKRSLLFIIIF